MKVLQVAPGLAARTGGVASFVVESALALQGLGVETTVFTTDLAGTASGHERRAATSADLPEGADRLDLRVFPARPPRRLAWSPALRRALARELADYDVVHVHSLYLQPQLSAGLRARRAGVPYLVSPHGSLDPYLRARGRLRKAVVDLLWQRRLLTGASALHATTEEEAALFADVAPGVARAVVPAPVPFGELERLPPRAAFRDRYLEGHAGPLVLNLGRVAAKKNLDGLVRAFAHVRRELPDARLAVVGPDDEGLVPRLRALAEREGVGDATHFVGMLRGRDKLAALAAADVWALPSHTENFGIAAVEALAAAIPVVVSPAVNIAAELKREQAALVCDADPVLFAAGILSVLRDGELHDRLAHAGRRFARRYDPAEVGARLAELYARVADG